MPLLNADLELFVDGSTPKSHHRALVAYAVTTAVDTLESANLPSYLSAQAAELFALSRALKPRIKHLPLICTDVYIHMFLPPFLALGEHLFPHVNACSMKIPCK